MLGTFSGDRLDVREIHRFTNVPLRSGEGLHWDIERLFDDVLAGAARATEAGPLDSLGIDTWAVDYGLLDASGALLGAPFHYRDARTGGVAERIAATLTPAFQYARTGIAQLPFNTLYQLCAERAAGQRLQNASTLLMIPDLLHYWLCGTRAMERTNASTTGALGLDGRWATDLLEPLGLSAALFADLVPPGTRLGRARERRAAAAGLSDTVVVAPATHDTASAVAGLPIAPQAAGDAAAFISCGTWSLLGIERAAPLATEAARVAGFTNETGVAGTTRFLTNIMGLWIVQECRRVWASAVPQQDEAFWAAVAAQTPTGSVIDVDDPALLNPADMPRALAAQLRRNEEAPVVEPLRLIRAVCEGLALRYRAALREAQSLAEIRVRTLHLVGGGARSTLLCRLTADACEMPVIAGPSEATGYGNLLVQLIAAGSVRDLAQGRELVRTSAALAHYEPQSEPTLNERAERLRVLRARRGLIAE